MDQSRPRRIWRPSIDFLVFLATLVIIIAIAIPGFLSSKRASNERNASTTIKDLTAVEADFRANDLDGNHINDFWTGDIAGLYRFSFSGLGGHLIERALAEADASPREPVCPTPKPMKGYFFVAMDADDSEPDAKKQAYRQDTGGSPAMGPVHNLERFGFCAYPAKYGITGKYTFIVNQNNTILRFDNKGEPLLHWPTDKQLQALSDAASR